MPKKLCRSDWKKRISRSLIERDGLVCHLCGAILNKSTITLDHLIPISFGGPRWDKHNIKLSCKECNNNRNNLPIDYYKMLSFYHKINPNLEVKITIKNKLVRVSTLADDVFKYNKKFRKRELPI